MEALLNRLKREKSKVFSNIRHLGYSGSHYCFEQNPMRSDRDVHPLDPFVPGLAGRADLKEMAAFVKRQGLSLLKNALMIIRDYNHFVKLMLPDARSQFICGDFGLSRPLQYTNDKYLPHWETLKEAGLLGEVLTAEVKFFSKYFSVPKNEEYDRAIFNGKLLSLLFDPPDPVNTMDSPRLLDKIQEWSRRSSGRIYMVAGDLRHWFHQIQLAADITSWFGLHLSGTDKNVSHVWTCLPMGWSWSPYIAQCVAYSFLLYHQPGETSLFNMDAFKDPLLPYFVPLVDSEGVEHGFLTVYYDNYILVSDNEDLAREFERRVEKNTSSERTNVEIKKGSQFFCTPEDLRSSDETRWMPHLGVQISQTPEGKLQWRIEPKKIEALPGSYKNGTLRETIQVIGKCLNRHFVSRVPIASSRDARDLINLLSRVSSLASHHREDKGWDTPWKDTEAPLSERETALMDRQYKALLENDWFLERPRPTDGIEYYLATDASKYGYGFVLLDSNGDVAYDFHKDEDEAIGFKKGFSTTQMPWHIYYKELYGCVEGILSSLEFLVEKHRESFRLLVLGDNTAAVGSLKNGYSSTDMGNDMIERLFRKGEAILSSVNLSIDQVISYHTIPTDDNVADVPSRAFEEAMKDPPDKWVGKNAHKRRKKESSMLAHEDFERRRKYTMNRVLDIKEGRVTRSANTRMRHVAPDDLNEFTQYLHDQDLFFAKPVIPRKETETVRIVSSSDKEKI